MCGAFDRYALAFLDHLNHMTDQANTRDVFQRLLADIPVEKAEQVWREFHAFVDATMVSRWQWRKT